MSASSRALTSSPSRINHKTFAPAALLVVLLAVLIGAIGIRPPGRDSGDRPSIPIIAFSGEASPTAGTSVANSSSEASGGETGARVSDCTTTPGDLARVDLTGTLTTESAVTWPDASHSEGGPATSMDWQSLPTGSPASNEQISEITTTIEQFIACSNANRPAEASSLFTDDYWRRMHNVEKTIDKEDPFTFVPLGGQPESGPFAMPSIENVILLEDGRVGAELHPNVSANLNFGYYVFLNEDGVWRIDEAMHVFKRPVIELAVNDTGFSSPTVYVSGGKTDLKLTNTGTVPHSIVIPALNIRIEVAPGESAAQTIVYGEATVSFYSDMPGDSGAGFSGEVIIDIDGDGNGELPPADSTPIPGDSNGFIVPVLSATIEVSSPSHYAPDAIALIANRDAQLILTNTNPYTVGNFTIDALGIDVDIPIGESVTVTINAAPGIYAFYCDQPFSAINGMYGTLIVLDPDDPQLGF